MSKKVTHPKISVYRLNSGWCATLYSKENPLSATYNDGGISYLRWISEKADIINKDKSLYLEQILTTDTPPDMWVANHPTFKQITDSELKDIIKNIRSSNGRLHTILLYRINNGFGTTLERSDGISLSSFDGAEKISKAYTEMVQRQMLYLRKEEPYATAIDKISAGIPKRIKNRKDAMPLSERMVKKIIKKIKGADKTKKI
ncbi:MAG: hypothetical protein Q8Q42_03845 [Nanoarchaeota archaeon]|nr:hypothetical protein [Nanoarchaeota archaeon]